MKTLNYTSGFKKILYAVSILLIVASVLSAAGLLLMEYAKDFESIDIFYSAASIAYSCAMALCAVQAVLMVGVFVFQIRRLREYGVYYLLSFTGLAAFAGAVVLGTALLAKGLENF